MVVVVGAIVVVVVDVLVLGGQLMAHASACRPWWPASPVSVGLVLRGCCFGRLLLDDGTVSSLALRGVVSITRCWSPVVPSPMAIRGARHTPNQ